MKTRLYRRKLQRGVTFIELLVASVILAIGLMAVVNLWAFSYRVTLNVDDKAIAYNLGRQAMESVKKANFTNATEGATTTYYDVNQGVSNSTAGRFKVVTTVTSSAVKSGTIGTAGAVPADTALRTITVIVYQNGTTTVLYQTNTYMARNGI